MLCWLFWIQISPIILVASLCLLGCLCVCCYVICSGDKEISNQPVIGNFLQSQKRFFNPEKDGEAECCSICLDEFQMDLTREIAELGCSNKHIFHLDCLSDWVKHKDFCPLCREPIVK